MEIIEVKSNNVKTVFIKTDKFKTISVDIVFLDTFSKESATKRSLLSRLLSISSRAYPTKKDMANAFYDLYNASLAISTYPSYKTSITVFNFSFVNPKYIKGAPGLIKDALKFLKEIVFSPNVIDNAFNNKDFREQKRILRDNIKNIYNNKSRYALRELLRRMSENEILSVSSVGTIEDLEKLTAADAYNAYKDMIDNESVSLFITGDFDNQTMLDDLRILGDFKNNPKPQETVSEEEIIIQKVKEEVERQDINQAKLLMGFRTDINTKSPLFPAALLFNTMFGGMFSSDLMRVVREEHSLAYYIASQIVNDVKILIVTAGIDQDQYGLASDLVIKQLESYKQGAIDENLLGVAKEYIINELIEIEDSPYRLSAYNLRNHLHDMNATIGETVQTIKDATPADITAVAKGINLDTIFLLAGENYNG